MAVEIRQLGPGDEAVVLAAGHLFDDPPTEAWTAEFFARQGHHLLVAVDDGVAVGFVSCVEMCHPDKGTEVFLYELGVDDAARRRGIGRQLVTAGIELARSLGCYGAWTITEDDNVAALATYRSAGAEPDPTSVTQTWDWRND
jgi:ribosomal protein S18 acetylase RimI-like enzyme